jgi:peptide/nickel transport system substrate-binding protein
MWFKKIFGAFTKKERITFLCATAGAVISFIVVMGIVIAQATTAIPAAGGQYVEGAVGQPEYINPVIASSETDLDLVKLVYQNLSDISDSVTASPDLKTWTVHLKDDLHWQDGAQLTADDVVFTVQSIQNPDTGSPSYQAWQGVTVSRSSELEVQFTLAAPYAFFGSNLQNLYILPKHVFADAAPGNWRLSDYNLKPVGSGPYKFISYNKDSDGFISSYDLTAWNGTSNSHPLIQNFDFKFFNNENALVKSFNGGTVDGFGSASPEDLALIERPYNIFSWRTAGYYAVFYNQSTNIALQDPAVREALSAAIDRSGLIDQTFSDGTSTEKATPEYGPIPEGAAYYVPTPTTSSAQFAEDLLDSAGWTVGSSSSPFRSKTIKGTVIPLAINLTVPQIDFLQTTASVLNADWQAIGVQVNITTDSPDDIVANTIKNRDYDALLFGNVLGPSSDLYSFWDSSQRFYPGLNLSILSDSSADTLIESARETSSSAMTAKDMASAQADIVSDYPATFLYSPDYLYVANANVQGVATGNILIDPSDRFRDISDWYVDTARVLK